MKKFVRLYYHERPLDKIFKDLNDNYPEYTISYYNEVDTNSSSVGLGSLYNVTIVLSLK